MSEPAELCQGRERLLSLQGQVLQTLVNVMGEWHIHVCLFVCFVLFFST